MSQMSRGELWRALNTSTEFVSAKPYREYTTAELQREFDRLRVGESPLLGGAEASSIPLKNEPEEIAGLHSINAEATPIREDENGLVWYVDEVRKSAIPKPRARRVIKYNDPGFQTLRIENSRGDYHETIEMPGTRTRPSEAKITLPSYQVGIYKDPAMPFKIHIYNEKRGFDYFEVIDYFGGREALVPSTVKRDYVSTTLVWDIQSTVDTIMSEYRERVLPKEL